MTCAVPAAHPLARKKEITADLAGESVIATGPNTRLGMLIEDACRSAGETPPVIGIAASSSLTACMMVSSGAGLALVDSSIERCGKFHDLAFRPFRPRIGIRIQLIFPRDRPRSRATQQLVNWMKKKA